MYIYETDSRPLLCLGGILIATIIYMIAIATLRVRIGAKRRILNAIVRHLHPGYGHEPNHG
jgi:hypothetical protein